MSQITHFPTVRKGKDNSQIGQIYLQNILNKVLLPVMCKEHLQIRTRINDPPPPKKSTFVIGNLTNDVLNMKSS